jgi:hypothetical protein
MNKWIAVLLIGIFAAGISVAGESGPWWKFGFGGNDKEQVENSTPDKRQHKDRAENRSRNRPQFSDEQRSQMKERYQVIKKLAEAARAETDPAKKAELTNQLRDKLTENAKKMQEQYRRRMKEAEKELAKMKERLDKGEADLEQRVEQKLQKLLSGEKPERKGKPDEERRRKNQNNIE